MASGAITRKQIIEDDAMNWGPEYAKMVDAAVAKNMEFVKSILAMAEANERVRKSGNQKELTDNLKKYNTEAEKGLVVWKEQDALERQLISTKKKYQLATESTNRALVSERLLLTEVNKHIKEEQRERLGMIGAYERLNKARTEAQKRLAELLSAEKANRKEIALATLEYDKLDARVKAVDAAIRNYSKNIGNYSSAFSGLNGTMRDLLSTFGLVTGMALFGTVVKDIFSVVRDFDRQLIAVGKTTNIAGQDLKDFGREVVEVGQRMDGISVEGLLKSSEVAGQLGVKGTANILKFSEAIEKLKLTSDIGTDEQVQDFAKFIEVSADSFENADKLASVITQLGNNFATTEAQVLSNATEIQKGIAVYKTSAQGVLGLGAATSSLGSEAEASRSAIQSTFGIINGAIATGKNLEKVLKLTNLTQKELSKQFNTDATGVFVKFVGGLRDAEERGENLALVLEDVEITEKRAFTVIGALAANYDVLNNAVNQANQEYLDNAALNKEVEAASQSLSSIIGDIKDQWAAYILEQNQASEGSEKLAKILKFVRDNLASIITYVIKYGSVLLTAIGVYKGVNYVIAAYNSLMIAGRAAAIQFTIQTGLGTVAMKAQAKAAQEAAAAQGLLNTAVSATPWGIILAAIAAVVVAYTMFNDEMDRSQALAKSIAQTNKDRAATEKQYADDRQKNLDKEFKAIDDEIALRKAKGESEEKLDKESIERKVAAAKSQLDVYEGLKKVEIERTQDQIRETAARIKAMDAEKAAAISLLIAKNKRQGNTTGQGEIDFQERRFDTTGEKERLARLKAELKNNRELTIAEQKRLNQIISDLEKQGAKQRAETKKEEDEKAKKAREKARKEYLDGERQKLKDEFALIEFDLKRKISKNDEIAKDESKSLDERITAIIAKEDAEKRLAEETYKVKFTLNKLETIDVEKNNMAQLKSLISASKEKGKLAAAGMLDTSKFSADQLLLYKQFTAGIEDATADATKSTDKATQDSTKEAQNEFEKRLKDIQDYAEDFKKIEEVETMNLQKRLRDKKISQKKYDEEIIKLRHQTNQALLKNQIEALEAELMQFAHTQEQKDAILKATHDLRVKLSNEETEQAIENELKAKAIRDRAIKETSDTIAQAFDIDGQVVQDFLDGLINGFDDWEDAAKSSAALVSAIMNRVFEERISNIDDEIKKSEDYYSRQIELAGDDQRKKEALQKESDKKTQALEKKKREEQKKQAIYNKALKATEVGINTAVGIMQAYAQLGPVFGSAAAVLVGVLGAVQLAAVLAAPIPKYKHGRKDGPDETAYVGDGGRKEVISRSDGTEPWITPDRPTLVRLRAHDKVWPSVEAYNNAMRASWQQKVVADTRMTTEAASYMLNFDDSGMRAELQALRKAFEKRQTVVVHGQKMPDINYQLYRFSKLNWNA